MYTIKQAAEIVGVSPSTLRAWERRYGLAPGGRSDAGYRLYDESAMRALGLMAALLAEGLSANAAAAEAKRRMANQTPPLAGSLDDVGDLARVAHQLDPDALEQLLILRFSSAAFETVVDDWLMPSLKELGRAWAAQEISVAGEHLVAEGVRRHLLRAYDAPRAQHDSLPVLLGLPPRAEHELGLLAFAVALRRNGLATAYLGANVPAADWATAVEGGCSAAVLAIPRRRDAAATADAVSAIRAVRPDLTIAVGGNAQDLAPADCRRLGHHIGESARRFTAILEQA